MLQPYRKSEKTRLSPGTTAFFSGFWPIATLGRIRVFILTRPQRHLLGGEADPPTRANANCWGGEGEKIEKCTHPTKRCAPAHIEPSQLAESRRHVRIHPLENEKNLQHKNSNFFACGAVGRGAGSRGGGESLLILPDLLNRR